MRASGTHNGKDPWQWQRSPDGKTWTDITYDPATVSGGRSWRYVPVAADVNNYLRACAALNATAPEGMTEGLRPHVREDCELGSEERRESSEE